MISHVFKMVWNRKGQNALILLEIFAALLVLFAVGTVGLSTWQRFQEPVGFDSDDVWVLRASAQSGREQDPEVQPIMQRLAAELRAHDAVQAVGSSTFGIYTSAGFRTVFDDTEGRNISMEKIPADIELLEALDIQVASGRWFRPEDQQSQHRPIVINGRLADDVFGDDVDPVGQVIIQDGENASSYVVIGVVEHFRKGGEFSRLETAAFFPTWPDLPSRHSFNTFFLEIKPGTDAGTEEELVRRMQAVAPDWSFDMDRLADMRQTHLRQGLAPLVAGGVVAAFLMIMVGLGLTGVLWQNITRRTREIGLRRAQGATSSDVHRQIVLEMLILATLGIALGLIVVVQLPIFGLLTSVSTGTLLSAFALAGLLLYILTGACAFYPSRLATGVHPAEALRHE